MDKFLQVSTRRPCRWGVFKQFVMKTTSSLKVNSKSVNKLEHGPLARENPLSNMLTTSNLRDNFKAVNKIPGCLVIEPQLLRGQTILNQMETLRSGQLNRGCLESGQLLSKGMIT